MLRTLSTLLAFIHNVDLNAVRTDNVKAVKQTDLESPALSATRILRHAGNQFRVTVAIRMQSAAGQSRQSTVSTTGVALVEESVETLISRHGTENSTATTVNVIWSS